MVSRILVPLDGEENSHKALPTATFLAKIYDAEIMLLTITYFDKDTDDGYEISNNWLDSPMIGSVKGYVKRVFDEALIKIPKDIKVSTYQKSGSIEKGILDFIEDEKIDIVVMSCKNLSFVDHILKGSISRHIVEKSTCPVIIIK